MIRSYTLLQNLQKVIQPWENAVYFHASCLGLEYTCVTWSPQHRKDLDLLEQGQRRPIIQGLEPLCYEERLRELELSAWRREGSRETLLRPFSS